MSRSCHLHTQQKPQTMTNAGRLGVSISSWVSGPAGLPARRHIGILGLGRVQPEPPESTGRSVYVVFYAGF